MSYEYGVLAEMPKEPGLRAPEPIKDRLKRQRSEVQATLDNLDNAIKFLEDNPHFEAFYDTLRKTGH